MLTQDELKSFIHYNEETGIFTYIKSVHPKTKPGQIIGTSNGKGYLKMKYKKEEYYLHRLAFLYMENRLPIGREQVDHINKNVSDNSWKNLRLCNQQQNNYNTGVRSKNALREKHISRKPGGKYRVFMSVNGTNTYFGAYDTLNQAKEVANLNREKYHKEFASS